MVIPNTDAAAESSLRPIWEFEEHYLCPVVGFCLTAGELKHLLKKSTRGTRAATPKFGGIELHEFFVKAVSRDTPIARKVQHFLERKYASQIDRYKGFSPGQWLSMAESFCNPECFGTYVWITASRVGGTRKERAQLHGKIHMYAYEMIDELRRCDRAIAKLRSENSSLVESLAEVKSKRKWAEQEIVRLHGECACLEKQNQRLSEDRSFVQEKLPALAELRETRDSMQRLLEEQVATNKNLQGENARLTRQLDCAEKTAATLKEDISQLIASLQSQEEHCQECEKVSLCHKRVLIVGGLSKMVACYRELVEKLDGRFDFHDGRCHNGNDVLRRQIRQSDLVICPVDINSHAACLEVKQFCKRTRKRFFMLRKASVSSVYTTLVTAVNSAG